MIVKLSKKIYSKAALRIAQGRVGGRHSFVIRENKAYYFVGLKKQGAAAELLLDEFCNAALLAQKEERALS